MSKEGVGDTKKVPEDLKGSFNFVTMSFMEDVSPEKEHAFTIHSVHDTEKNARDHVDEKIESFQFVIGRTPDLTGMGKVPDGLSPRNQPKEPKSAKNLSYSEQEAELLHLKSMFDKNLITKDVYEQRQRDILG